MVVEDSVPQRMVAVGLLRKIGLTRIEEAADGADALQLLKRLPVPPAVLLVDLEMPGMDGVELLHRIAAEGYRAGVIIASARELALIQSVESMVSEMGLIMLGALSKPLSEATLRDALLSLADKVGSPKRGNGARLPDVTPDELSDALERKLIVPWFQPKLDLQTWLPRGAEALARWRCDDGSLIEPMRFIAVAEEHGLMPHLTVNMVDASLAALRRWDSRGLRLSVAINLSPVTLNDQQLADDLIERVAAAGIEPSRITFEVTETAMAQGVSAVKTLLRLKLRGFSLAIDDFGTGFSSMQQLSKIPFSELKIDRSIVHDAHMRPNRRTILESAIEMGRRLGMVTVGEGVERIEDLHLLRHLGCELAQGYFVSRPVSFDDFLPVVTHLHRSLTEKIGDSSRKQTSVLRTG
ncbi:MAG: EAL domain-containing response regulator [Methyloversatilis sp.]|nr:EAL domain-containing response regulator [Methyloversatilis sp.]